MASYDITAKQYASAKSLSLSADGKIVIDVSGFLGWGIDINITSTAAAGNFYIYTQYTNPVGDTFVNSLPTPIPVVGGNFGAGVTRQTIDSNNLTTKGYVIIAWVGTDISNGSIGIVGLANGF
jgi:hypothetical protein